MRNSRPRWVDKVLFQQLDHLLRTLQYDAIDDDDSTELAVKRMRAINRIDGILEEQKKAVEAAQ